MRLETGRVANPTVKTIALYLRACGALWGEITGILDYREPVPIDTKAITDSELSPEDKQRLEWAIEKQVRKFETKLAMPMGGKPLHPARQAEAVRKLRNYRIVVTLMEQAVAEVLADRPVVSIEYPRYKAVEREALGLLWRATRGSQKSKVKSQNRPEDGEGGSREAEGRRQNRAGPADKLAEKAEYWGMQKLEDFRKLTKEVLCIVS